MSYIMLLQNVSFFCSLLIFSGVNSGKDINFCSHCGMSSEDVLSRDILDSSGCVAGKVFYVLYFVQGFSMLGLIKISRNSIGLWVDC